MSEGRIARRGAINAAMLLAGMSAAAMPISSPAAILHGQDAPAQEQSPPASAGQDDDWTEFVRDLDLVHYYAANRVEREGDHARVWIRAVQLRPSENGGPGQTEAEVEFDCTGRRVRTVQTTGYWDNGEAAPTQIGPWEWRYLGPSADLNLLLPSVCRP